MDILKFLVKLAFDVTPKVLSHLKLLFHTGKLSRSNSHATIQCDDCSACISMPIIYCYNFLSRTMPQVVVTCA